MLQKIFVFKPAIDIMFSEEFWASREEQDKRTLLEIVILSYADFEVTTDVVHVLDPFQVAQEAFEGEKYISLLPMIIQKLGRALHYNLGAVVDDDQPQFCNMLFQMIMILKQDGVRDNIQSAY